MTNTTTNLRQELRDDFVAKRNGKLMFFSQVDATHISLAATDGRKDASGNAGYIYALTADAELYERVDTMWDD